jgi:hypothetical protein
VAAQRVAAVAGHPSNAVKGRSPIASLYREHPISSTVDELEEVLLM